MLKNPTTSSEMESDPFVSSSHASHDVSWKVQSTNKQLHCVACLVELLEDPSVLLVQKRLVLSELLGIVSRHGNQILAVFQGEIRVVAHLALILIDLSRNEDDSFVTLAVEATSQILCLVKSDELITCVMDALSQQTLKACNYKRSLPAFNLLGSLLHAIPALANMIATRYGSLLDYMCSGLDYPDESVQASVCYVCLHVFRQDSGVSVTSSVASSVPSHLSRQICVSVLQILTNGQHQQLKLNALGLLKTLLEHPAQAEQLMVEHHEHGAQPLTLTSALKRHLLAREDMLPVASVQCVSTLLQRAAQNGELYAGILLQEDMAEFLFEVLISSNELLISSVFCCLLLLTEAEIFFSKCHAVYGMESILRGLDQAFKLKNTQVTIQGLQLLDKVLHRHPGSIRLFSRAGLVTMCLGVIQEGLQHQHLKVFILTCSVFTRLLSKEHLLPPIPYQDITGPIVTLTQKMAQYPRLQSSGNVMNQPIRKQADMTSSRSMATQHKMAASMSVLCQACVLGLSVQGDPLCDETTFAVQGSQGEGDKTPPSPYQQYCDTLLEACHTVCIPTVIANLRCIDTPSVFVGMFTMLQHLSSLRPQQVEALTKHLLEAGSVTTCLNIKDRFGERVSVSVDEFLCYSLSVLHDKSPQCDSLFQSWTDGLANLKGGAGELVWVLTQNSHDPVDLSSHNSQVAALSLLYAAILHGDSLVCESDLHAGLQVYLDLHGQNLHKLHDPSLKALTFLLAVSSPFSLPVQLSDGERHLLDLLQRQDTVTAWCAPHLALLKWGFACQEHAQKLGPQMLAFWLIQSEETDDSQSSDHSGTKDSPPAAVVTHQVSPGCSQILQMARSSPPLLTCLMNLVTFGSEAVVGRAVSLLENLLVGEAASVHGKNVSTIHDQMASTESSEAVGLICSQLPHVLQKVLLVGEAQKITEHSVEGLLQLMCSVSLTGAAISMAQIDFKLAYHVCGLVTSTSSSSHLVTLGLRLLTCLMYQALIKGENTVASVLLSNPEILQLLEKQVADSVCSQASSLLSLLMEQQHISGSQVSHVISLDGCNLLAGLGSDKSATCHLCALQLWSVYFRKQAACPLVDKCGSEQHHLVEITESSRFGVVEAPSTEMLRSVVLCLQQLLMQDHSLVQQASLTCMENLLASVRNDTDIVEHLVHQPWTRLLVQVGFQLREPPAWVLTLVNMLMDYNTNAVSTSQLFVLVKLGLRSDTGTSGHALHNAIKKIVERGLLELEPGVQQRLKDKLSQWQQDSRANTSKQHTHNIICQDDIVLVRPWNT